MTRYITVTEVYELHDWQIDAFGGAHGVMDHGAIDSAVAQPQMTYSGEDLYPTLTEKVAALGYSLVQNHAFVDGNKRVGFYSMIAFAEINDAEFVCEFEEAETVILNVAAGKMRREEFAIWVATVVIDKPAV